MIEAMSEFWSVNEGTFWCLHDAARTGALGRAIAQGVTPGDVVVELGAGSGILSMFAADAGAARVYAVELDRTNLRGLQATLDANGYGDTVVVVAGDALSVELPEPVDTIICEMIATGLIEELQLPAMRHGLSLARTATPTVVLQEYVINADLVDHRDAYHGKRIATIRYEFADQPGLRAVPRTPVTRLVHVDFRRPDVVEVDASFTAIVDVAGVINGLRISTETIFCDGSTFGHSPSYSPPLILPVEPRRVEPGQRFDVAVSYTMCAGGRDLAYSVSPAV